VSALTTASFCATIHRMRIVYRDKTWELKGKITIRDAIKKVGLDPQAVLALRGGKLVTDDTIATPDDTIKLIAVVSGG
jgi:sulfur carrier protein ThiS